MMYCYFRNVMCQDGFILIEFMIVLVLGFVVIGGVISVFFVGQCLYVMNKVIGDVQDSFCIVFEMMVCDICNVGFIGCGNSGCVVNVLKNSMMIWWEDWNNVVYGYGIGILFDFVLIFGIVVGN